VKLAYNGSSYHGWQSQQNAHSVQDELERCLSLRMGLEIRLTGCGRTDTGVHARIFYAHFDCDLTADAVTSEEFISRLNLFLPDDIVVYEIFEVRPDAHARFDASSRTYHYQIARTKNPFTLQHAYYLYGRLDVKLMEQAAVLLFDYNDFTSFSKLHSQTLSNECQIFEAEWKEESELLIFRISANRFLRNMVRAVVGTLIEVGRSKLTIDQFREVIEAKNRSNAGFSVPAHGLYLVEVKYPDDIYL
jgi:tRNA pseudouridine38-40 synthase